MDQIIDSILESFIAGDLNKAARDLQLYGVVVGDVSNDNMRSGAWRILEIEIAEMLWIIIKHNGEVDTLQIV